jgi:hypothetical protein
MIIKLKAEVRAQGGCTASEKNSGKAIEDIKKKITEHDNNTSRQKKNHSHKTRTRT